MFARNEFQVHGKTVVLTGGSRGMGLAVGRQLAEKGANVVIVARDKKKLLESLEHIRQGASHPETQRFHQISADLTSSTEAVRVIDETVSWNSGPPDIVWCCAGTAHPTLFIDTPVTELDNQMTNNYFTSLYMAHATLSCWLRKPLSQEALTTASSMGGKSSSLRAVPGAPRHIIFTASILAFYSVAGYSSYSPCKAALRSLSDTLSQELNLYAGAHPEQPPIRLHTIFPGTIYTEGYEKENRVKTDLTKMLEEGEGGQTPESIASKSIRGLEGGEELITTDFSGGLLKRAMLGGTHRRGFWRMGGDWIIAAVVAIVVIFVRGDMDRKARAWGRNFGTSGMKGSHD
ncbi:hypothetical protein F4806DRAFT_493411 [Annulohypoxylon nitens]|nr:hypothetical protein F4806DRAFT_493411 [Annulohypoxylon nitens]